MTIRPGAEWGSEVARPADLTVAATDAEAMDAISSGRRVGLDGGDLHRTVGARPLGARAVVLRLPVDLIVVTLDDGGVHHALAHVLCRRSGALGWWFGELLVVMNAEFMGKWDLAPRSHPNDGRLDVTHCPADFGLRLRLAARSRLATASHLPHPALATSVVTSARPCTWDFVRPLTVFVDGRPVGRTRRLGVEVRPDAAVVHT